MSTTPSGRELSDYTGTLLSHEWLAPHGGSENVFEQMAQALPGSQLQCLWNDAPERFGPDVTETWLARTPFRRSKAVALSLMPLAWKSIDTSPFERVVVSSHAFAHQLAYRAAAAGKGAFAYVHTPARYIWSPEYDTRGQGALVRRAAAVMRKQDRNRSSERVHYAANSEFVRQRINAAWGRDSVVIYPPVGVRRIQAVEDWAESLSAQERSVFEGLPREFVLGASRLVEYKRLDLAIKTAEAVGLPAVIAGAGPYGEALRELARSSSVPVFFTGRVSDSMLFALYQRALLFSFMAIEDFGIMPVEAMSVGTPVLVSQIGGAAESVRLSRGGVSIRQDASRSELASAADRAMRMDRDGMRRAVRQFDEAEFRLNMREWIDLS